jgi:hypothetical protein
VLPLRDRREILKDARPSTPRRTSAWTMHAAMSCLARQGDAAHASPDLGDARADGRSRRPLGHGADGAHRRSSDAAGVRPGHPATAHRLRPRVAADAVSRRLRAVVRAGLARDVGDHHAGGSPRSLLPSSSSNRQARDTKPGR